MSTHRIKVSNEQPSFTTLWLEPWGEDYGMLPGDEFEVLALDAADDFYFHLAFDRKGVKVCAEGDAEHVSVYREGEMLHCGHNRRQEAW
jgi:hypothetical protein